MKLEPVPKIFGHLDMKAAIKWILVLEMVLLFISGCSQPVPDPQISLYKRLGGDCLLYTSPSPRDRTRSRMPSSA